MQITIVHFRTPGSTLDVKVSIALQSISRKSQSRLAVRQCATHNLEAGRSLGYIPSTNATPSYHVPIPVKNDIGWYPLFSPLNKSSEALGDDNGCRVGSHAVP